MKLTYVLYLVALSTAFVLPEEHIFNQITIDSQRSVQSAWDKLPSKDEVVNTLEDSLYKVEHSFGKVAKCSKHAFDSAVDHASEAGNDVSAKVQETGFAASSWINSAANLEDHPHDKPNQTIYQLISSSKYTTKLAAAIDEYPDLVVLLNGTLANYTLFAPIDSAFEKIPKDAPKPSKEDIKKALLYHVSPEFYPAGKVLVTHTVPTALTVDTLGVGPQRLSTNIGIKGLTVNFYSRIIAINIVSIVVPSFRRGSLLTQRSLERTVSSMVLIVSWYLHLRPPRSSLFCLASSVPSSWVLPRLGCCQ